MFRTNCVICKGILSELFTFKNYPLLFIPTNSPITSDIFYDSKYGICVECCSIQLINLIDPEILYSYPNKSELSILWKLHHVELCKFIKNNIDIHKSNICEIGGGNNNLYNYMNMEDNCGYTILDLYEPFDKLPNITYKIGNCETYTDYNENILILSHTFEHLYKPLKFIETCSNTTITDIFISVPNMKYLIDNNKNMCVVFAEHTFYFEKEDIEYMFNKNGFLLNKFEYFTNHSLFFHFKKIDIPVENIINLKQTSANKLKINFEKRSKQNNIIFDKPTYIMPSHYMGQSVYLSLLNKNNIIGFLDNDKNKIGMRLYGTTLKIESPNILKNIDTSNINILLLNNIYYNEIYSQLIDISPKIHIIKYEI